MNNMALPCEVVVDSGLTKLFLKSLTTKLSPIQVLNNFKFMVLNFNCFKYIYVRFFKILAGKVKTN